MPYKFCNFFPILLVFYAVKCLHVVALASRQLKSPSIKKRQKVFRLYLQGCKQWISELCNLYPINQLKPIQTYFKIRLVPSDICIFYLDFMFYNIFATLPIQLLDKNIVDIAKDLLRSHTQFSYTFKCYQLQASFL